MAWLGYLQKYNSFFVHDSVQWKTLLGIAENVFSLLLIITRFSKTVGTFPFILFFNLISKIPHGLSTLYVIRMSTLNIN